MVKYEYDVKREAFMRVDRKGKPLYVNITEAQEIIHQLEMGKSTYGIDKDITLVNPKSGISTVTSFVKNYRQGNIIMPEDAPAPVKVFESMVDSDDTIKYALVELERIEELEERVSRLEEKSIVSKVKSWMR